MSPGPDSRDQGFTEAWRRRERVVEQFEDAWRRGQRPKLEDYLPADADERRAVLVEFVRAEFECRTRAGEAVRLESYLERYPELAASGQLSELLDQAEFFRKSVGPGVDQTETEDEQRSAQNEAAPGAVARADAPIRLGRYRVTGRLGSGSYGVVFKAHDDDLGRDVAIKVPHQQRVSSPEDIGAYLAEARILASLNHPGIVPVYDAGRTEEGLCYVVYKFIQGNDLRARMKQSRPALAESVEIVARVAEALHHAHQRGLVHRDVKPANILLDVGGLPYLADFGLALRADDFGRGPNWVGTPLYMSPEQARAEGHRVDARSDVYSLGVVFYELLTGQRPFPGSNRDDVLDLIKTQEPRPPRQLNDTIPRELDRICVKSLSKRAADRYSTAIDLAEDLRHWQAGNKSGVHPVATVGQTASLPTSGEPVSSSTRQSASDTDRRPVRIVPKGLRSFDGGDADFFLELLPGPKDREGMPDSIRFWKRRIETRDANEAFSVGLLYGPSGCGKSSLVKAGLLPRLARHVLAVYVEATAGETETRLLKALRTQCPGLPNQLDLVETLTYLRAGRSVPAEHKVLVVLDQFEQWLHAQRGELDTALVRALRQCDGEHLQCLIMVRDDFWMATTSFMRELEIPLLDGRNCAAVELFERRHARKLLAAFGRAFGALPDGKLTPEQERFLDQAVDGLAQDGKVISVRLSLLAEMIKGKAWKPATLKEVGGAQGIGVAFLEETFSAATAPPQHRLHQKAVQAMLNCLLSEVGPADIKGRMRSQQELLDASGYGSRPREFAELLRILDSELRLITPTDPEGVEGENSTQNLGMGARFYQITHDYLVPSLRDWLTGKQKETWRGRAELRLKELAALWGPRRDRRFLPSLPEYLYLWFGVPTRKRRPVEKSLLRTAGTFHALIWGSVLALLLVGSIGVQRYLAHKQAQSLVEQVLIVPPNAVPYVLEKIAPLRALAAPLLREKFENTSDPEQKLHAALALSACGEGERVHEFLLDSIETAPASEAKNLIAALAAAQREQLLEKLLARIQGTEKPETKARYAITLFHAGNDLRGVQFLKFDQDPTYRSAFIHVYGTWHGDLAQSVALLESCDDPGVRSGLCGSIGEVDTKDLGADERESVKGALVSLYVNSAEAATHSSTGWALRQWQVPLPELETSREPHPDRDWFVNKLGMTMIKVRPGQFRMGSLAENRPLVELTRHLYACDREVSVKVFRLFIHDKTYSGPKPVQRSPKWDDDSADPDDAAGYVSWNDAILFCNWLSHREGRGPCYKREGNSQEWHCDFDATGYRLPTSAEWEYICRAGTTTAYSFGNDPEWLSRYAWIYSNSNSQPKPGGLKLPNNWGFFDMHGNLEEWCWDWKGTATLNELLRNPSGPAAGSERVLRGGGFFVNNVEFAESGCSTIGAAPDIRTRRFGFRVVRSATNDLNP